MDDTISLQVTNLSKSFAGKKAVYDFSLQASKGEVIGFIGPNGSGKTTVIRMICGLVKADSGTGKCLGYDIETETEKIRDKLGYMPQYFSLYNYLTVYENLLLVCQLYKLNNVEQRIDGVAKRLTLVKRLHQKAGALSGGWKQRLSLAASLINDPELLLLDEPTAGVDPDARLDFWRVISEVADQGTTILVSTHYMSELERCHRVVYLVYGHVIAQGYISDIIREASIQVWQVIGKDLHRLANEIQDLPGIDNIVEFGASLHVISKNKYLLLHSLRPYLLNLDYQWRGIQPTLEDIFISLIAQEKDQRDV